MIDFADGLDRFFQLLIIVQPTANLGYPLATNAELPCTSTGVGDRENKYPMTFAARALWAVLGMSDDALQ